MGSWAIDCSFLGALPGAVQAQPESWTGGFWKMKTDWLLKHMKISK